MTASTLSTSDRYAHFSVRVKPLLEKIYVDEDVEALIQKLFTELQDYFSTSVEENLTKWSEDKVLLITYGDSICSDSGEKSLVTLSRFLDEYLQDTITGV
ncbi:MAG: alpha-amylase, partial [Spirulinaceae cyanobacterium]